MVVVCVGASCAEEVVALVCYIYDNCVNSGCLQKVCVVVVNSSEFELYAESEPLETMYSGRATRLLFTIPKVSDVGSWPFAIALSWSARIELFSDSL